MDGKRHPPPTLRSGHIILKKAAAKFRVICQSSTGRLPVQQRTDVTRYSSKSIFHFVINYYLGA